MNTNLNTNELDKKEAKEIVESFQKALDHPYRIIKTPETNTIDPIVIDALDFFVKMNS